MRLWTQRLPVIVSIYDPRAMKRVLEALKRFNIEVSGFKEGMCYERGIFLVDNEGLLYIESACSSRPGTVLNVSDLGVERALATALLVSKTLRRSVVNLVIGVDCGREMGIAAVADSHLLFASSYRSSSEALKDALFFLNNVEAQNRLVRVGLRPGSSSEVHSLINRLLTLCPTSVKLELVPEHGSSKNKHMIEGALNENVVAAINIALARTKTSR